MDKRYKVISASVFKQGSSNKNGKVIPWTIYQVTLDGYNGQVTGFDAVNPGDEVVLVTKQNGQYTNTNYAKPQDTEPGGASSPSGGGGTGDRRILKLLVVIAEQVGVDREKVMEILET